MLKIFLAEDEVIVRETIKRMIPWENLGFELVGEAADGEMALSGRFGTGGEFAA